MKKLLNLLCVMMTLCWVTSCTETANDFYQYINGDTYVMVSVDALSVMQNAGFKIENGKIEIPDYIPSANSMSMRKDIETILGAKGIDPRRILLVGSDDVENNFYVLAKLTDADAFGEYLTNYEFDKTSEGGYKIYSKEGSCFVIDDNIVLLLIGGADDMPEIVDNLKKEAQKSEIPSWQKDIMSKDNTAVCLVNFAKINEDTPVAAHMGITGTMAQMIQNYAYLAYTIDLKGAEMQMVTKAYDKNGSKLEMPFATGKLDKSMLKYANNVDFVAMLAAAPDNKEWKKTIIDLLQENMMGADVNYIKPLIELINGKIMASFGYDNIQQLMAYGSFHYSVAVQAEKGKGAELFDAIKGLLHTAGAPYKDNGDMLDISLGYNTPSVLIVKDDNNVVFTSSFNRGKSQESIFKSGDFSGGCTSLYLQIPPRSSNITFLSLPYGIELKADGDEDGGKMTLKLTNAEGGLLENIIKTASSLK